MIPAEALTLAKTFEGLHKVVTRSPEVTIGPYVCPAGFWTIGYGHLCDRDQQPITEEQAENWLRDDMTKALNATLRLCPVLSLHPLKLAAITDFTFNLGAGRLQASTLRTRINQQNWSEAAKELRRWVYGGGKPLPGLVARREAEILLLTARIQ